MSKREKTKQHLIAENQALSRENAQLKAAGPCLASTTAEDPSAPRTVAEDAENIKEKTLRHQALTFENMFDAVILTDAEGLIIDWNPAALRMFGYTREEVLRQRPSIIHSENNIPHLQDQIIQQIQRGERWQGEVNFKRKDGTCGVLEVNVTPWMDESGKALGSVGVNRDITKRKRAEHNLRTIFNAVYDAIFIHAEDGTILDVNDKMLELYGVTHEQALQLSIVEDYSSTDNPIDELPALWKRVLAGQPQYFEWKARRPNDGSTFDAEVFLRKIALGERDVVLANVRDITERKRAEAALRKSEERFNLAVSGSNDGLWDHSDISQDAVWWSPQFFKLLGYQEGEIQPTRSQFKAHLHPEDREPEAQALRAHLKRHLPYDFECRLRTKSGDYRWFRVRGQALWDKQGQPTRISGSLQDITERKQSAEERERLLAQVREQARQIQQIIDTVPAGVLLLDPDHQIILANPLAQSYLTVLAKSGYESKPLVDLGNRPLVEILGPSPEGIGYTVENTSATPRTFNVTSQPIESGPTSGGWVLVLRDITHELQIQQQIHQQERLAAVGQLAAGIAHDFNNILATIVLYTQIMLQTPDRSARDYERLAGIEQQAKHATNLIQQILDFSRRTVLKRQPLDLLPFLKEQVKLLKRTLPENITITFNELTQGARDSEYQVEADPTRIQQIIMNLALNARDAMPEGGELTITLQHQTSEALGDISIPHYPRNEPLEDIPDPSSATDWIQIKVSDTGTGIARDILPHIFEPFFTTKEPGRGTGLGLPQVLGIVQQHGGHIQVKSQEQQGTTFTLTLPALSSNPPKERAKAELPLTQGKGQTILLVEDDPSTREALQAALELLNYQVITAANGRDALAILEGAKHQIALLLSDVVMPQMGGIALVHALREQGFRTKIIMMTGHPMSEELETLQSRGEIRWLSKPVSLEQLAEVVRQALNPL